MLLAVSARGFGIYGGGFCGLCVLIFIFLQGMIVSCFA
jgi:hypothetical protein